jgi:hypothetical protein
MRETGRKDPVHCMPSTLCSRNVAQVGLFLDAAPNSYVFSLYLQCADLVPLTHMYEYDGRCSQTSSSLPVVIACFKDPSLENVAHMDKMYDASLVGNHVAHR